MTFTLNFGAIATTVVTTAILALAALVAKGNRTLQRIEFQIGTTHPPEGILGRLIKAEIELSQLREWCILKGYDRRNHPVEN